MSDRGFQYVLRCTIEPGRHEEERLDRLIAFCTDATIDDVMLFILGEELNTGHPTIVEIEPWMQFIARAKARLAEIGVTTSINPWATLLHADRGRMLKPGQAFERMVDPTGRQADAVACPLCPAWLDYMAETYRRYAEIQPSALWVEDDFRLHNHAPLTWGGCFCERHMAEFRRIAGAKAVGPLLAADFEREEFVRAVLRPGAPHPARSVWLQTARDAMVAAAKRIGDAVHSVSPATRVGLMSSDPSVHCAEGRSWEGVLRALAGPTAPLLRPNLPAYSDTPPQQYLWGLSTGPRQCAALVPHDTDLFPEVENSPYPRFSKSNRFLAYQVETSMLFGSTGITMNLFDMMGNGVLMSEGYQKGLATIRPFVDRLHALGLRTARATGVQVMVCPTSSWTMRTRRGHSMTELYPSETFWAGLLTAYGIANAFCTDGAPNQPAIAISGQSLHNLDADAVAALFARPVVLLDGDAAHTLCDMGLGHLAGIENIEWIEQNDGRCAYEQVADGQRYLGISEARASCQNLAGDVAAISYGPGAEHLTRICNPDGRSVCPGVTLMRTPSPHPPLPRHGGGEGGGCRQCVVVWPYGRFGGRPAGHLNPLRQALLQELLCRIMGDSAPTMVTDDPHVGVFTFAIQDRYAMLLVNGSGDDLEIVRLRGFGIRPDRAYELRRDALTPVRGTLVEEGSHVVVRSGLGNMEVKAFVQA
ncbi:MAG: hypothetical protein FJX72_03955 [Armatimonadetes bacterium]|nr:hypothetical protein [Armatimonadota bacterium]